MLNIPNTTSLVFDIGCGCGYFSHICQEYGHKVYSLDVEGTRAGHLFGRCQDIFALDMYLHTIKPFQPLPILPEKVDLTVGLTAHFHELPGGKFWGADAWRFFFKDLSKNMKLNGKLYLEAVIFEPLRKFQPEDFKETEDLFSSLGATINTYRIMFDSVEKFGQLPDVAQ